MTSQRKLCLIKIHNAFSSLLTRDMNLLKLWKTKTLVKSNQILKQNGDEKSTSLISVGGSNNKLNDVFITVLSSSMCAGSLFGSFFALVTLKGTARYEGSIRNKRLDIDDDWSLSNKGRSQEISIFMINLFELMYRFDIKEELEFYSSKKPSH
uniref:Uncharacterized protein n=1 Tax=Glossina brevipalpis TaxID=37001 RepID=A0A1A9W512_9MUSC